MTEILQCRWKPMRPGLTGIIHGHLMYTGTLQVLVDRLPEVRKAVHRRIGKYLYAEQDGWVSVYLHRPGSTGGFAGREIALNIEGKEKAFHGSLWGPTEFDDTSGLPEYRAVTITDRPDVMERGYTFCGYYVTKVFFDQLLESAND